MSDRDRIQLFSPEYIKKQDKILVRQITGWVLLGAGTAIGVFLLYPQLKLWTEYFWKMVVAHPQYGWGALAFIFIIIGTWLATEK